MMRRVLAPVLAALCVASVQGMDIRAVGTIRWNRFGLGASSALNLASAGLRLPGGRSHAEELADMEFPRLIRPILMALPVDSSSTLEDLIVRGDYSSTALDAVIAEAERSPSALSTDLKTLFSTYTVDLKKIVGDLVRHRHPTSLRKPLVPSPTRSYTGIVIFADEVLPVHGKSGRAGAEPCLFPKIWDTDMNLIYERNMVDPDTARREGIVRYVSAREVLRNTPSGLDPELQALVGREPLRILARGLFGVRATDPIIDRQDALAIVSSDENLRLLREGRVVIVLPESALEKGF